MKVSQDYAGSFMTATWLANFLKEHGLKELTATIASVRQHEFSKDEKPKYVLAFVGKTMEAAVSKTNAFALANDLGDDTDSWPGNKVVLSTSFGQTPNGMGHIMHMRGVPTGQQPVHDASRAAQAPQPTQGNGSGNAYAAASQPAAGQPPKEGSSASSLLNDEIPF